MHPAPSVILFTTLSGMGFGCLAFLALGMPAPVGWPGFLHWGAAYALAVGGLTASAFHLGNPQRALLAFTQWRTSWLSREGWTSVLTLLLCAPIALSDWLGLDWPRVLGPVAALMCFFTVLCTAMIYAQLKTVPRWRQWTTPALFLAFAVTGGAILTGNGHIAIPAALILGALLAAAFRLGDRQFAKAAQTIGTATGLDRVGAPTVFEQPHTGENYLMREMIHRVGRKHAARLRLIALIAASLAPAALLALLPGHPATYIGVAAVHLTGSLAARWLFFAEAEHVVGLYYGKR